MEFFLIVTSQCYQTAQLNRGAKIVMILSSSETFEEEREQD